ncbi:MAG: AAA family ATPase [Betaproteobacteria bacterium]|nr:AAA family ATPase [Betaproteobacteria bacterium]
MRVEPSHLRPESAEYLERPNAERIRYIQSPHWIGYPRGKEILGKLEELLNYPKSHRMPNLLIVGDTNNGKSMLVQRFCQMHPPDDTPKRDAATVPVLWVESQPVPDEARFYNAILELLFVPHKPTERADRKQFQAVKLMKAVGLRMLIIDEIHNLLAGSMAKQRIFLNVIKYLGNTLEIPIVGVGTREAFRAIQTDPQLSNRFEQTVLGRWTNNEDFLRLLATFERLLPLRNASNLVENALADTVYAMSEGYIGEISKVLVKAAVAAVETGQERIDRRLLGQIDWVPPSARRRELAV